MNDSFPRSRREYCVKLAASFLAEMGVSGFPLRPASLIHAKGWALKTYDWLAGLRGIQDPFAIMDMRKEVFLSEDAMVARRGSRYLIVYDERARPHGRVNFSLMHEVGHVALEHLDSLPGGAPLRSAVPEAEMRALDREADCFASNTLAPAVLARAFQTKLSPAECARLFRVSLRAWETRLAFLDRDFACMPEGLREAQKGQFMDFVRSVEGERGIRLFAG